MIELFELWPIPTKRKSHTKHIKIIVEPFVVYKSFVLCITSSNLQNKIYFIYADITFKIKFSVL